MDKKDKPIRVSDTASFIAKATAIHNGRYTYPDTVWVRSSADVVITCAVHGNVMIRADRHISSRAQGCKLCMRESTLKSNDDFLEDCIAQHGDTYILDKVQYKGALSPIIIGCHIHGDFVVAKAANFANGSGCPACGRNKTTVSRRLDADALLAEMKITHNNKYTYPDNLKYFTGLHGDIKINCPEHGEFTQLAATHKNGGGCLRCGIDTAAIKKRISVDDFIKRCNVIHNNNFDYTGISLPNGIRGDDPITIKCIKHNQICNVTPHSHLYGSTNCPQCMSFCGVSKAEGIVCDFIKTCLPDNTNVITSDNKTIRPKQLDIVIPDKKIAFEYCGVYWHQEARGKDRDYHLNKHTACVDNDIRLVQIYSHEWENKQEIVKSRIATMLKAPFIAKYNARSLYIRVAGNIEKRAFLDRTHIQGNCSSSVNLALVNDDDEIVSLMTFGKARFNKNFEYELIRFSTELNSVVRGAASRLFKHFIKSYNPTSILSYSDRRWNTGNVYSAIGLEYSHNSKPNYLYFHKSECHVLFSRNKFQKHKLAALLDTFDPTLTEWDNMQMNGYGRIWDCGNTVFTWHVGTDTGA